MNAKRVKLATVLAVTSLLLACATTNTTPDAEPASTPAEQVTNVPTPKPVIDHAQPPANRLITGSAIRKATINDHRLAEISGITAASDPAILFWAINDSGNDNSIFAIGGDGNVLNEYQISAKNRDWESLSRISIAGQPYLIVGETGDNLRHHKHNKLYIIAEPKLIKGRTVKTLPIHKTIVYRYPDGHHNVEAMAAINDSIYLITKQPIRNNQRSRGRLYRLPISHTTAKNKVIVAEYLGQMQMQAGSLASQLAASLAGVDLDQATDLVFSTNATAAYVLTYRQIIRFQRQAQQSWADTLLAPGDVIHTHGLRQAEAITSADDGTLWFVSEKLPAPIWALPIQSVFE